MEFFLMLNKIKEGLIAPVLHKISNYVNMDNMEYMVEL
jgi:hypothetical protein